MHITRMHDCRFTLICYSKASCDRALLIKCHCHHLLFPSVLLAFVKPDPVITLISTFFNPQGAIHPTRVLSRIMSGRGSNLLPIAQRKKSRRFFLSAAALCAKTWVFSMGVGLLSPKKFHMSENSHQLQM